MLLCAFGGRENDRASAEVGARFALRTVRRERSAYRAVSTDDDRMPNSKLQYYHDSQLRIRKYKYRLPVG